MNPLLFIVHLTDYYGLGHRALLIRLPSLNRTLAAQNTLMPLIHALLEAPHVTLVDYQLGTLRWGDRARRALTLDGQVTMDTPAGRRTVGLLWDGDDMVPMDVLRAWLRRAEDLRHAEDLSQQCDLPPVLVITCMEGRVLWPYPVDTLWTTVAALQAQDHPLEARWVLPTLWGPGMHDRLPRTEPLLAALDALLGEFPEQAPVVSTPCRLRPGRRLDLEQRLGALRRGMIERKPTPPGLLALALPPRALDALATIGRHPLLRAPQLAELCNHPPARLRATLALLAAHDLAEPDVCGDERVGRYVLTRRGLRLLAARVGLSIAAYREAYSVLEDAEDGVRHGLDFAAANLAHTTALQEVFFAFIRAARTRGAELWWQWEWACVRVFEDGGVRQMLRPDAEVVYDEGGQRLRMVVELDRSTCPLGDIADQLRRYHRYAQATADVGMRRESGKALMTIAYVTTKSDERARNIIATANTVVAAEGQRLLDVRAVSLKRLLRRGPMERIWRRAGVMGLTALFPERRGVGAEATPKSPYGGAGSGK